MLRTPHQQNKKQTAWEQPNKGHGGNSEALAAGEGLGLARGEADAEPLVMGDVDSEALANAEGLWLRCGDGLALRHSLAITALQ